MARWIVGLWIESDEQPYIDTGDWEAILPPGYSVWNVNVDEIEEWWTRYKP